MTEKRNRPMPDLIEKLVGGRPYRTSGVGLSRAEVRDYGESVLKIEPRGFETDNAAATMRWLEGKFPAPRVLAYEEREGMSFLLTTRAGGAMACDARWMSRPAQLVELLARALHELWALDIAGCPAASGLDAKLRAAREAVLRGEVDVGHTEQTTFGSGGFRDPEDLLRWLEMNRPQEEPVFTHGDFCLPNVFVADGGIEGLIDWGRAGVCDRWQDIALCWRSLKHNAEGAYGGPVYPDVNPDSLFSALGIAKDAQKLRYYLLLDELF